VDDIQALLSRIVGEDGGDAPPEDDPAIAGGRRRGLVIGAPRQWRSSADDATPSFSAMFRRWYRTA
jgi:hypothetical protein